MSAPTEIGLGLREGCRGVTPLSARLEPWQTDLCAQPEQLAQWLERHGSPLNLIDPAAMGRNATELRAAAGTCGADLEIYFARKANKALAFVDEARRLGLGVDVASERELAQTLDRGVAPSAIVLTAAVKPAALLELAVAHGVTVVVDNHDEADALRSIARRAGREVPIAPRLAPVLPDAREPTRFGLDAAELVALADTASDDGLRLTGLHFHLDGYRAADRVAALHQCLGLADELRGRGHDPGYIDMGGGIPMSYLDDGGQWQAFWDEHRAALRGEREPVTFAGHGLGLIGHEGEVLGSANVYPAFQEPVRGDWLASVLQAPAAGEPGSVADALRERGLTLRCEPGRSLVDGCGLTVARVEFRKRRADGTWLIGLAMNRTQCRSAADDFLVDPLLLRRGAPPTEAIEGYFVGAYCIERELLSWRRMVFPAGVAVGDLVVFPNTAGYFMHILESASHQIPLARNLVVPAGTEPCLDPIDAL